MPLVMMTEIERKYLVKGDFKSRARACVEMKQGYICADPGRSVRVRICGDAAYLTIKGPAVGISRFEWERQIPVEEGEALMKLCHTGIVLKTRYIIDYDGHIWEVDEFHGDNEGLVVAEIELKEENEKFALPQWISKEVTSDPRYLNTNLAANPYKNW